MGAAALPEHVELGDAYARQVEVEEGVDQEVHAYLVLQHARDAGGE